MNQSIKRLLAPAMAAIFACTCSLAASAQSMSPMPMGSGEMGGKGQCGSDHNLIKVHRRLLGAIQQLSNDQHDYGGHRVTALNDLQAARTEIVAAESYAQTNNHVPAHCFNISGVTTGGNPEGGMKNQSKSNGNLTNVSNWVGKMIEQLQSDSQDYGGHRDNAVKDMQQAQTELQQAGSFTPGPKGSSAP